MQPLPQISPSKPCRPHILDGLMFLLPLIPPFERCCEIALETLLFQILSFVVEMLSSGQRQRNLGQTTFVEVHSQRNKCESALLGFPKEPPDLLPVEKELSAALGIIALRAAVTIGTNMNVI